MQGPLKPALRLCSVYLLWLSFGEEEEETGYGKKPEPRLCPRNGGRRKAEPPCADLVSPHDRTFAGGLGRAGPGTAGPGAGGVREASANPLRISAKGEDRRLWKISQSQFGKRIWGEGDADRNNDR